jgi:multidrug efflux pump subunit AcrA (membrane-fusion protein)
MKWPAVHRVAVGALALLLFVAAVGCGRGSDAKAQGKTGESPPQAPSVKAAPVQTRDLAQTVDVTGEVVATESVVVSATVEGPIAFFPWREGDRVPATGAKLVVIDRAIYQADVQATRASLEVAKAKLADLKAGTRPEEIAQAKETVRKLDEVTAFAKTDQERVTTLVNRGGLSGESLDKARVTLVDQQSQRDAARQRLAMLESGPTVTQVAVAQAAVEEAAGRLKLSEAKLGECTLSAPFAGIVSRVLVHAGDMAGIKTPLLEMFNPASLVVRFAVPEAAAAGLHAGLGVSVQFDALPGQTISGKVTRVYPDLDRRMRTRTVEAIPTQAVALMPGIFARVRLTLRSAAGATVVPTEAILRSAEAEASVFVVNDGTVQRRPVKTGISDAGLVQVLDGLEPGQKVVVGGLAKLKDGMAVSVSPSGGKSPPAGTTRPEEAKS